MRTISWTNLETSTCVHAGTGFCERWPEAASVFGQRLALQAQLAVVALVVAQR